VRGLLGERDGFFWFTFLGVRLGFTIFFFSWREVVKRGGGGGEGGI